jgi:hypothetical protein
MAETELWLVTRLGHMPMDYAETACTDIDIDIDIDVGTTSPVLVTSTCIILVEGTIQTEACLGYRVIW